MHRQIEEMSLNAWPALRTYVYDGWLLRFADGYTKRSNSVSPLYEAENGNMEEKVSRCERMYNEAGLPVVFKMTKFAEGAADLDSLLEQKGYRIADLSSVKVLEDLSAVGEPRYREIVVVGARDEEEEKEPDHQHRDVAVSEPYVTIEFALSEKWLAQTGGLLGLTERQMKITRVLLGSSKLKQGFFTLYVEGIAVACGIGVIENGYVGLYDIVTHAEYRGRGYAEQLIRHLLRWARVNEANKSYLLVVQANASANRLYDKFGYREIYSYWYRVKEF